MTTSETPTVPSREWHRPTSAEKAHSTTYVANGVEAARVAMELERAWRASQRASVEREPGEDDE